MRPHPAAAATPATAPTRIAFQPDGETARADTAPVVARAPVHPDAVACTDDGRSGMAAQRAATAPARDAVSREVKLLRLGGARRPGRVLLAFLLLLVVEVDRVHHAPLRVRRRLRQARLREEA